MRSNYGSVAFRRAVVAVLLVAQLLCCLGQGLSPTPSSSPAAQNAASQAFQQLLAWAKEGASWRQQYSSSPETTCSSKSGLCAATPGSDNYSKLIIATSPVDYDTRKDAGTGYNPLGPVRDQRPCSLSVAFAVTAAAEAAVASVLRINGSSVSLSQQDLQFCPGMQRDCYSTSDIRAGLNRLVNGTVVSYDCLPYTAPQSDDPAKLCNYRCKSSPRPVQSGRIGYTVIREPLAAQKQIMRSGSYVTRLNLYQDFFEWNRKIAARDPDAVYRCPNTGKQPDDAQAVAVVGYNNKEGYWLVRNSWGTSNGNKGYFKVNYDTCGVLSPAETFGVYFVPSNQQRLQVTAVTNSPKGKRCYIYKANKEDYISKVADRAVVSIGQLLLDNLGVIRDLNKPLTGLRLRICDPDPASIWVASAGNSTASNNTAAAVGNRATAAGNTTASNGTAARGNAARTANGSPAAASSAVASPSPSLDAGPSPKEAEVQALLALKGCVQAPGLSDWVNGTDPCGAPDGSSLPWQRVYCSKLGDGQHVYLVDLSSMGLTGTLCDAVDFSGLTRLQALWFSINQLTGTLPKGWAEIRTLQEIRLDQNVLTGTLPTEWSGIRKLKRLYLNGNRLSGSLPAQWGAGLANLEFVYLASNGLTGIVPASWSKLSKLKSISIYDNVGLTGCLPSDWNARDPKVELVAGPQPDGGVTTVALTNTGVCGYCQGAQGPTCIETDTNTSSSGNSTSNDGAATTPDEPTDDSDAATTHGTPRDNSGTEGEGGITGDPELYTGGDGSTAADGGSGSNSTSSTNSSTTIGSTTVDSTDVNSTGVSSLPSPAGSSTTTGPAAGRMSVVNTVSATGPANPSTVSPGRAATNTAPTVAGSSVAIAPVAPPPIPPAPSSHNPLSSPSLSIIPADPNAVLTADTRTPSYQDITSSSNSGSSGVPGH